MKKRALEYLEKLRACYAEHRVLPSFPGIANLVGLNIAAAVSTFIKPTKTLSLDWVPYRRL